MGGWGWGRRGETDKDLSQFRLIILKITDKGHYFVDDKIAQVAQHCQLQIPGWGAVRGKSEASPMHLHTEFDSFIHLLVLESSAYPP